jgi:uncharacterized membrane protein
MVNSAIVNIARFASLLFGGLFAGFLVTVLVIELTLRNYDASVYTQVRLVELARLDNLATATLMPTLIATAFLVILAVRRRTRHTLWLTLTALILLVSVLVTTIVFNLPINAEQSNWAVQAPPADWASVRDRWQIAHAVRTSAAVLAFGCLSTAAMGTSAINLLDHSRTDRRSPATWDSVLHQGGRA